MQLQNRLVTLRTEKGLSQEELAEKLYVSRQTISNWERGKTYPDINSLLLIATYFDVSLDNLIKGDVEEMKQVIVASQEDLVQVDKDTKWMLIGMLSLAVTAFPLLYFLDWLGIILLIAQFIPTLYVAYRIERFKKTYDVQTYKEIVAISTGQTLDEIEKIQEKAKYPYQKVWIVLAFSAVFILIMLLVVGITLFLFHK
ncbi:helix-turn-helix domain-containing protein [Streptococcus caprae]|uniref:Helix-turn-helix domain-containing protein n=1 Tax=Streptococcus caprae TaxID=1640501 RepID=A0ABV8CV85_9STRE